MTDQFFPLRYEGMRGVASRDLTGHEAIEFYQQTKPVADYVSDFIEALATGPAESQFTPLAKETERIMRAGESEFWFVKESDMAAFASSAMIFPGGRDDEAYPAIALNQDRLLPFDHENISSQAKEEVLLAIIDLPATKRLIERRGIKVLSVEEFLMRVKAATVHQRVVRMRKWLTDNGFMDQLAGR